MALCSQLVLGGLLDTGSRPSVVEFLTYTTFFTATRNAKKSSKNLCCNFDLCFIYGLPIMGIIITGFLPFLSDHGPIKSATCVQSERVVGIKD